MRLPILSHDCAASIPCAVPAMIGPGVQIEPAATFRTSITKDLLRPPTLEISATPNGDLLHVRKLERAVDPATATPFWRANVPIGMVIERDDCHRFNDAAQPKSGEIMEIPGTVEDERWELGFDLPVKSFDKMRRRGKTKMRPPSPQIERAKGHDLSRPRPIEI